MNRNPNLPAPRRVLVVDDDLSLRVLAALLLEHSGYSPIAVASVTRALARLDEGGVDLVVTDLRMPERTGLDLLSSLRVAYPRLPAIVMTGSADDRLVSRALELGARVILRKPFSADELRVAVESALNRVDSPRAA
jgi:CheY-like chemotaxis protein